MKKAYFADYIYYNHEVYEKAWLLVENDLIKGISTSEQEVETYSKHRFENSAIFPGLINTHNHLGMGMLRGIADDLPLMEWLNNYIWPTEEKVISPEFVFKSTLLSLAESIRSGVTCINEMYFLPLECKKAMETAGIRGVVGFGVLDSTKRAFELADKSESSDLVSLSICPHAPYTVPFNIMKECVAYAEKNKLMLHSHLAETLDEENQILERYGKRPVEYMLDAGAFDIPSIFAHCVHINDSDMKIMVDKKVNISHCLESNMKLASGFSPVVKMQKAGINVSIGTDGASSNNDISMIGEMNTVSKFHKAFNMDATALPAKQVLEMATSCGAKALYKDNIGNLVENNKADFFVLSFDAVHMTPVYNPISHLIYTAKDNDITDVFINGSHIMKDRKILTFDEEEMKQYARKLATTI